MPNTHSVTITLQDGTITVSPDELIVNPGDTVNFVCDAHPWAVQLIAEGAPNSRTRQQPPITPTAVAGGSGVQQSVTVNTNATLRTEWDYVVAVWDGTGLYTRDPDIVIGSRPNE